MSEYTYEVFSFGEGQGATREQLQSWIDEGLLPVKHQPADIHGTWQETYRIRPIHLPILRSLIETGSPDRGKQEIADILDRLDTRPVLDKEHPEARRLREQREADRERAHGRREIRKANRRAG